MGLIEKQRAVGSMRWTRSIGTSVPVESKPLPIGAIIGIAIVGAVVLFVVLVLIGVHTIRKKHRREKSRILEADEGGHVEMDSKFAIRSNRPPEIAFSRRLSFNPFMPLDDGLPSHDWSAEARLEHPPNAKTRRLSPQKTPRRMSGLRDSWPLNPGIPLSLLPGQHSMTPSVVAPPGYELPPSPNSNASRWPKRSASKQSISKTSSRASSKASISLEERNSVPSSTDPYAPAVAPARPKTQRSTSENHLSTILRSTSQRLKSIQRQSLTRSLTTLGRSPGPPPTERAPNPPRRPPTESREHLIKRQNRDSVGSFMFYLYSQGPCPGRNSTWHSPRNSKNGSPKRARSPTPSTASDDSLCAAATPDLVIPAAVSSPSKRGSRGEQRYRMRISSDGAKEILASINRDNRALPQVIGAERKKPLSGSHRISLASDPFYSSVNSAKTVIPQTRIQGPRPLYIRKAIFGKEATTERPKSFVSPFRPVSGNAQPPKKPYEPPHSPDSVGANRGPEPNPFQWSPQEAMQARATQTSPVGRGKGRKGHKRSNVIHMSNLPPPPSVAIAPEEPEEDSPLKFRIPSKLPLRAIEPMKSPSPAPSAEGKRLSGRPPSAATFSPALNIPDLPPRSEDNSPTLGLDIVNMYSSSPTLSENNYYAEASGGSEDEFFNYTSRASSVRSNRHSRSYSTELRTFPNPSTKPLILISFSPPKFLTTNTNNEPEVVKSPSPVLPRPLPNISTITPTSGGLLSSPASPAPPPLTIPIPGHLTGPRAAPLSRQNTLSPPRGSIQASIYMLRRMNSEVSTCSYAPSPTLPELRRNSVISVLQMDENEGEAEERGRSRGSQHYLSMGMTCPKERLDRERQRREREKSRQRVAEKRDSHRVYKGRRKRRNEEVSYELGSEFTPVKEVSSPATAADLTPTANPRLSGLGIFGVQEYTPSRYSASEAESVFAGTPKYGAKDGKESNVPNEARRSDATMKATINIVRRESKMQYPSPQTPPKWGWSLGTKATFGLGQRLMDTGVEEGKENVDERPVSLGLYDHHGFLRTSSDRKSRNVLVRALSPLERERRKCGIRE